MACGVCGLDSVVTSVFGSMCQKHWDNDKAVRAAYFRFRATGADPVLFPSSDEFRAAAEETLKAENGEDVR